MKEVLAAAARSLQRPMRAPPQSCSSSSVLASASALPSAPPLPPVGLGKASWAPAWRARLGSSPVMARFRVGVASTSQSRGGCSRPCSTRPCRRGCSRPQHSPVAGGVALAIAWTSTSRQAPGAGARNSSPVERLSKAGHDLEAFLLQALDPGG